MRLRQNKPMAESPRIVDLVMRTLRTMKPGEQRNIRVPWSYFVFSTRDGKAYLPPTIAQGMLYRQMKGFDSMGLTLVHLASDTVPHGEADVAATYGSGVLTVPRLYSEDTVRHELLHFTQSVGASMIQAATGRVQTKYSFGLPKKKVRTYDDRVDVEFHPYALTVGTSAAQQMEAWGTGKLSATQRAHEYADAFVDVTPSLKSMMGSMKPSFVKHAAAFALRERGLTREQAAFPQEGRLLKRASPSETILRTPASKVRKGVDTSGRTCWYVGEKFFYSEAKALDRSNR